MLTFGNMYARARSTSARRATRPARLVDVGPVEARRREVLHDAVSTVGFLSGFIAETGWYCRLPNDLDLGEAVELLAQSSSYRDARCAK